MSNLVILLLLVRALFVVNATEIRIISKNGYSCDWWNDACPWKSDAECDHDFAPRLCAGQDCADCDPASDYHYTSCEECTTEALGHWCPGDAICQSEALDAVYWTSLKNSGGGWNYISKCPNLSDWASSLADCEAMETTNNNVYNDPLYSAMSWQYRLIHVEAVWKQNITGKGVHVRVNDDGVDASHPEFADRFDVEHSCNVYLPVNESERHGTACASIIAGAADNDDCTVGIAPGVTLSACNIFSRESDMLNAEALADELDTIDISSNSWGPLPCFPDGPFRRKLFERRLDCTLFQYEHANSPCNICGDTIDLSDDLCHSSVERHCWQYYEIDTAACIEYLDAFVDCEYDVLPEEDHRAFERSVTEGRGGKGVVFTFPAGNEREFGSDGNLDGLINSRYTIAVGAVDPEGKRASYSTPGAPVLVAAPAGDIEYVSNTFAAVPGGGCAEVGMGTSYSTPVVAGVVALMLEVNPELSWRDVQGVLAKSSQKNDPTHDSWSTNAAGYHHSYFYGFGLVDALAAVNLARTWQNWGPEESLLGSSGVVNVPIPDDPTQIARSTIVLTVTEQSTNFIVESVVVYLELFHGSRGDLEITLTSPSGTKSLLAPSKRPENTQLNNNNSNGGNAWYRRWKLTTVRNWGESPIGDGDWTLSLVDEKDGILSTCADLTNDHYFEPSSNDDQFINYWNCDLLREYNMCRNGKVKAKSVEDMIMENGRSAVDSCCACGGGTVFSDTTQYLLKSWNIVVYGHIRAGETTVSTGTGEGKATSRRRQDGR